ncbi:MAG: CHAD domain-containing protein [Pseudomonadota bacterium]
MPLERELKLRLAPDAVGRLRQHPAIREKVRGTALSERLANSYFDSPEGRLRELSAGLRIRRSGTERRQTLKILKSEYARLLGRKGKTTDKEGVGTLHSYLEFEEPIEGDEPNLECIDDRGLRKIFAREGLFERLEPIFTTDFHRHSRLLVEGESEIELSLDEGEIRGPDRVEPLCEAELELKSGRVSDLLILALQLSEIVPLALETRTKAHRGYALAHADTHLKPDCGSKPALKKKASVRESFEQLAGAGMSHLLGNVAAVVVDGNPTALHQLRVSVRRLRALFKVHDSILPTESCSWIADELRWFQKELGPAREWDVFMDETLSPLRARLPQEGSDALVRLRKQAQRRRNRAYSRARATLQQARFLNMVLQLQLLLESGDWGHCESEMKVGTFSRKVLDKRLKKLRKLARNHAAMKEAELHEIRIAGKKLRYAIEFYRSLYPRKEVKAYSACLVALQDSLGTLNDAVTGRRLLDELASGHDSSYAHGLVQGWQAGLIERDLDNFQRIWQQLEKQPPFWKKTD